MPHAVFRSLTCLVLLLVSLQAAADPASLARWEAWLLEKHPDSACPWVFADTPERACLWPGRLNLEVQPQGLLFTYEVEVFQEDALAPLPGGPGVWPLNVTVNGARAAVLDQAGQPQALLARGKHRISGQFRWQRRPAALPVPDSIALVSVTEGGQAAPAEPRPSNQRGEREQLTGHRGVSQADRRRTDDAGNTRGDDRQRRTARSTDRPARLARHRADGHRLTAARPRREQR